MSKGLLLACSSLVATVLLACGSWRHEGDDTSTPNTIATPSETPNVAGTVIGSFGKLEPFESFESAEGRLGWRIMRSSDPRFHLVRQGGLLRTDADIGLPHLEQHYAMDGHEGLIGLVQEPEAYIPRLGGSTRPATIAGIDGEIEGDIPDAAFLFFSGERIEGQRIRVKVYTEGSSDITEEDFVAFVASLGFENP